MELFAPELMAGLRAIIKKEIEMQLSVRSSARELQETMDVLRSKLHGLRKEKIRDLDIRKWIDTLENIMYDADDVLDECHFRDSELRLLSTPPSPASSDASVPVWRDFPLILTYVTRPYQFYFRKFCSNRDMSVKLEALNSRLKMLKTQRDNMLDLHLLDNSQDILPPVTDPEAYIMPSVASCSDVVGVKFRQDAEFMVRLLTEHHGSDDLLLYAIVGPGGIGKTTMANLIFESLCDKKKQRFFDGVIRVTVPRKFDKLNLLKRIITATGGQWAEGDLLLLDEAVKEAIRGKRLLLFLDDVCDAMGLWNLWLSVLFRSCAPGSRVLITTRNRDAAEQMKAIYSHPVQRLTGDEGWELLCRCVGSAPEAEQMKILKNVGLQIVEKCYGNPLAIMSMGGMLCLENKARVAWERILEDDDNLWSKGLLNLPDGIHKDVYFAFDNLPSAELRNCFVYCSLFPDAYEISCSDLIELWVAEGIVPDDETALSCFIHLIRRNVLILQLSPEFTRTCKMDGISRSLGRFIIQGGGLVITQTLPLHSLPCLPDINYKNKLRRLSLVINNGNVDKAKTMEFEYKIHKFLKKQPSLRTLLLFNHPLPRAGELLHHLPSLRLLNLKKAAIFELPESIGSLVHLRFLDLSGNEKMKKLPESIGKLANLKSLHLESCKELSYLPRSFLDLKNLMYFDAWETRLESLPEGMGKAMLQLRKIRPLRPHEEGKKLATMQDLKEMKNLRSLDLEISGSALSGLPKSKEEVSGVGILASKMYLRELVLRWKPEEVADKNKQDIEKLRFDVSDKLSPPKELEELRIIHYYGPSLPNWLSSAPRLPNLRSLQLEGCLNLKVVSGLGQLPCLEHLLLKQAPKVTSVGKHFFRKMLQGEEEEESSPSSSSTCSFPKLKVLHFEDMAEWVKWEWPKMESETSMEFPSLQTLNICKCPKLKSIPEGLVCRLKMLRQLIIDECPELRLEDSEKKKKKKKKKKRLEDSESFPSFLEIKIDSKVIQRTL